MSSSQRLAVVACLTLVVGTALAGCTGGGPGAGGGDGSALTTEEARNRIQTALRSMESNTSHVSDRVSVNMTLTNTSGQGTQKGYLSMFFDATLNEVIFQMSGEAFGSGSGGSTTQISSFTIAQMGNTTMFGGNGTLISTYNESAKEVRSFDALGNVTPESGGTSGSPTAPFTVIAQNLSTEIDSFTSKQITYEGKDALEIESAAGPDGEGAYLRVVIWQDPDRLALIEGRITAEQARNSSTFQNAGEFTMSFQYGEDAGHPLRDALLRGETLTFREAQPNPFGSRQQSEGNWTNRTIQPSRDIPAGDVPLDEVTAIVTKQQAFGESQEVIAMGLENGSATDEGNVTLTYDDADGNGMVTESDEIRMRKLDENATFSLSLKDEVTGLRYTPSAGLVTAVGALGTAAALVGTRRRD